MMLSGVVICCALLPVVWTYYERSGYITCGGLISGCTFDSGCAALYKPYMTHCEKTLEEYDSNICSNKCRRSLKALMEHPLYSRFSDCQCNGNNVCVKQKCKLMESCLGLECRDTVPATVVPYTDSMRWDRETLPSSTPSDINSITMSSSTVSLGKVNCETVILHCTNDEECDRLLKTRDRLCAGYKIDGSTTCTRQCSEANTELRENSVGRYMTSCKFETVELDTTYFTYLISTCVITSSSTAIPSTSRHSLPPTDCKRNFDECSADPSCRNNYRDVMRQCKRLTKSGEKVSYCPDSCPYAVQRFTATPAGQRLWSCGCSHPDSSKRCTDIKTAFSDICRSDCVDARTDCRSGALDGRCRVEGFRNYCKKSCGLCFNSFNTDWNTQRPLSTEEYSVDSTSETSTPKPPLYMPSDYFSVNWTCNDKMQVRIEFSEEAGLPHFTAEDKKCKAILGTPPGRAMILNLKYDPESCGTHLVKQADNVRFKNTIYVRSETDHTQYSPIADIECAPAVPPTTAVPPNVEMNFYADELFSDGFWPYATQAQAADIVDLGEHKTVYVELTSSNSTGSQHKVVPESCYATPNGEPDYPKPYYFLRNGCRADDTFKMHTYELSNLSRFSFYRIRFADAQPGLVYIHCNVVFCNPALDKDCKLSCPMNSEKFSSQLVTRAPYTFHSSGTRTRLEFAILLLSIILCTIT